MEDLNTMQKAVAKCLELYPDTRNSDFKLYAYIVKQTCPLAYGMNFATALWHANELNLPKFETIIRLRRKAQAEQPELRGCKEVQDGRNENEAEFREWARA